MRYHDFFDLVSVLTFSPIKSVMFFKRFVTIVYHHVNIVFVVSSWAL